MTDIKEVERKLRTNIEAMLGAGYYLNDGGSIHLVSPRTGEPNTFGTCIMGAATYPQWERDPAAIVPWKKNAVAAKLLGCTEAEAVTIEHGYMDIYKAPRDGKDPFYALGMRLRQEFYGGVWTGVQS